MEKKGKGKAAQAQAAAVPAKKKEAAPAAFPEGFDLDPVSFLIHPQVCGTAELSYDGPLLILRINSGVFSPLAMLLHLRYCIVQMLLKTGWHC